MDKNLVDKMPYQIDLVIGDWTSDGHGKTKTITITSNLDKSDIEKAYSAGVKKTKVDFDEDVASEYEDSCISTAIVDLLAEHGFKIEDYSEDEEPDSKGYILYNEGYCLAWLFIAQVGNPDFKYEFINNPNINIGGYGLFY